MAIDQSVINFAVYEDSVEYLGMSKATLPDVTFLTQSISGAGVGGNVRSGHSGPFGGYDPRLWNSAPPRRSPSGCRSCAATALTCVWQTSMRILFRAWLRHGRKSTFSWSCPNRPRAGTIAPATPTSGSGEYAVRYWATYINGKKVRELDPLNFICYINGVDYLAGVRAALGK